MLKVAILYANPLAHLTQWGAKTPGTEKKFIYDVNASIHQVRTFSPDLIFVNKQFDTGVVNELVAAGHRLVYFYGDYRHSLPELFHWHARKAHAVLLTWHRQDIYDMYNCHHVPQGIDPTMWHPIWDSPEIYDIVFTGNNSGGDRASMLARLASEFSLFIVGNNWPKGLHSTPQKHPETTNKFLSLGKVNIGLFNFENLSNVRYYTSNRLYQGMASGRPHIAPRTEGVGERFEPEDCYMDYTTYEDLRYKINTLLSNTYKRRQIGRAQSAAVMDRFTITHMWERIEKIINKL